MSRRTRKIANAEVAWLVKIHCSLVPAWPNEASWYSMRGMQRCKLGFCGKLQWRGAFEDGNHDRFAKIVSRLIGEYTKHGGEAGTLATVLIQRLNGVLESAVSREAAQGDVEVLVRVFRGGLNRVRFVRLG